MLRTLLAAALAAAVALPAAGGEIRSSVDAATLAESKRTALGFYLTPRDAHAALGADPGIVFIDVRDPIEVAFVGRPEGIDAIVPVQIATHRFDAGRGRYVMVENTGFVAGVDAAMARAGRTKSDPVFVICRSGGRSAHAAAQLIEAGYANVWSLVEGFEGDKDDETGRRELNGWRNAGLPWTYSLNAEIAWQPAAGN